VSQVRTFMPKFTVVALKMWAYMCENRQNSNFWYKFATKVYIPVSDFFTVFGMGEVLTGLYPCAKFNYCHF